MRHLSCIIAVTLSAAAQSVPFLQVLPATAATQDEPGIDDPPFGANSGHYQLAYDGSVANYQGPVRITAIDFRADRMAMAAQAGSYTMTVAASTSRNAVNALSTTFAANHGPDRTVVYSGGFAVGAPPIGQNPNPFGLRVPFFPAFEWDPRLGPLLLDFDISTTAAAAQVWDNTTTGVATLRGAPGSTVAYLRQNHAPVLRLETQARAAPTNASNIEGNALTGLWAAALGYRRQDLYEPTALGMTQPQVVTGLAWRTDGGAAMATGTFSLTVILATGTTTAGTMGTTFDDNLGPDRTIVYSGMFTAPPSPANADPTKFDLFLPLQRPFWFDPTRGPLVVDVRRSVATPITPAVSFDAVSGATNMRSLLAVLTTPVLGNTVPVLALRTLPVATAPTTLANQVNASSSVLAPFSLPSSRALHVIPAADSGVFLPTFVRHLRFRPAVGLDVVGPTTFRCSIDLSHATRTPATLSSTFDQNHGSDRVRVFDGEFSVPHTIRAAGDTSFPVEVCLQRPFRWDPAVSPHLVVDIAMLGITGAGFALETTTGLTVDDGRVTANAGGSTGTIGSAAFVVQLGGAERNGLTTPYGHGCPGANGQPQCVTSGVPMLPNHEFRIGVLNAPVGAAAVLALGFTAAATPISGAPGCLAWHGLELGTFGLVIADAAGTGSVAIPLRSLPPFDGLGFRAQWLVLDPTANALGATTSDALQLTARFF